jgi:2-polyprenyl-3-methyl-5-hydroxy-6-metoxy-1,4-benzoquinol methylase
MRLVVSGDAERARGYFERLAPDYDRAFHGRGKGPLNAVVNRYFRGPTFARRMRVLEEVFADLGLAGKSVLDLGCGSGQVAVLAAGGGARVHAIDVAPSMLAIAREAAARAGVTERIEFQEADVASAPLPAADITLLVGVIEYYRDFEALIRRAAEATRQTLVIAHTTRIAYRMVLRKLLARAQRLNLYYHPLPAVTAAAARQGFKLRAEHRRHAFSVLVFDRV